MSDDVRKVWIAHDVMVSVTEHEIEIEQGETSEKPRAVITISPDQVELLCTWLHRALAILQNDHDE